MASFDGYDPTKEGAGDGVGPFDSPFFDRNMVVGDSAGATMTHRGLADMADISGGPALDHLDHHSSSFGEYHHHHPAPLQQFSDFLPQHGDATNGTPINPSPFDQLALAYSPLASPGGGQGLLSVAGAGHLLPADGHPYPSSSLPLTQELPWPETSPETHAWITDTIYRSGPSNVATADPLDPSEVASPALPARFHSLGSIAQDDQTSHMFSPADYAEAPPSMWDPGPSVAGEASAAAGSQGWSSTAREGAHPEKVRRRRGRPCLYEDDGIEVPKRKPGRPLTYAPVTDSFGSRSSMSNMSPSSADGSAAPPFWEGPVPGRSAPRPAKRNQPADEATEQDSGEAAAQAIVRTRNKAAATRYRLKIQNTVDRMEAEEREASLHRQALLAYADRLRGEVNSLKTEVMQHAKCGCPHISGYISAVTQHTLAAMTASPSLQGSLSPSASQQLPAGVSSAPGVWQELDPALSYPPMHLASCPWQQGGFVMGDPVPGPYYAATSPPSGTSGEVRANVDGYFQSPMSSSNADSRR